MGSVSGKRILVVEDDADIVELFTLVLGVTNEVEVASNGQEALAKINADGNYDLIISDFNMPRMGGAALHNEIKAIDPTLAGRMMFVSGQPADAEVQQLLGTDKPRFICKPFSVKELRTKVEAYFQEQLS